MKKFLALLLAAVMTLSLVACGGSEKNEEKNETPENQQGETTPETNPVEDIKIGFICVYDINSGYDAAHILGLTEAAENLGIDPEKQITFKYNTPQDETCYDMAVELADDGCDIVFATSYGHQSYMQEAAAKYPDTIFVNCTGDTAATSGLANFKNMFPYTHESRYVSGVVAGMKLKELMDEGKVTDPYIGYVGAYPFAEVVSGYTAFFLGIRSIVPEAHMDVQYTNSWYEPIAEAEAANMLMSKGCVIISEHSNATAAPSAVQALLDEGKTVYSVGYNIDMLEVAPTAALTSAQNNWVVLYQHMLEKYLAGEEVPTDYACGIANDGVMISPLGESCAPGTQEAVDAVWTGLKDGSIQVFDTSTFTVNGETVTSAFGLDSDGDFVNDYGEAISNGAFQECTLRSAPYFALRIDGITELNNN